MSKNNTQTSGGKLASGGNTSKVTYTAGTSGNDWISSSSDVIDGDPLNARKFGNDVIYGASAVQTINGGGGNDWTHGGGGYTSDGSGGYLSDTMHGGDGIDWVSFQPNAVNDANGGVYSQGVSIDLESGAYSFDTGDDDGSGADIVASGTVSGFENVWGSEGNDTISGSSLNNDLHGGGGADDINGRDGDDELEGQAGNDTLTGGNGADELTGGNGDDELTGGDGDDRFVFEETLEANGVDSITDFDIVASGGGDVIDLSNALGDWADEFALFPESGGADINDYIQLIDNGSGGADLFVDLDGAGSGGADLWATLDGVGDGDSVSVWVGDYQENLTVAAVAEIPV